MQAAFSFEGASKEREAVALAKLPACIEHIRNALENENKIVVFAHHKSVIECARSFELAEFNPVKVVGDTPADERQGIVDLFQDKTGASSLSRLTQSGGRWSDANGGGARDLR